MNTKQKLSRRDLLNYLGLAGFGLASANLTSSKVLGQTEKVAENLQGAGFYHFKIGEFECAVVSDGYLNYKPTDFFINPQSEIEKALEENLLPLDNVNFQLNSLVVKNGKNVVLFDTGLGGLLGKNSGHLIKNLKRAGISPTEITDIFISHTHLDHINGIFDQQNNLNFPNAVVRMSQTELTAATAENSYLSKAKIDDKKKEVMIGVIKKNIVPLKDRIKTFEADTEILPGISALREYGHTPGHSTYLIKSGNDSLLFVGDLIHHIIQLSAPQIEMFGNDDLKCAAEVRQKVLSRVAKEKIKFMPSHFPFPGFGKLRQRDAKRKTYDWIPIEWQW